LSSAIDIVVFFLIVFGAIYVLVDSFVFAPIRIWLASLHAMLEVFVYCASCTGFWVGGIAWFLLHPAWCHAPGWCGLAVMGLIAVVRAFAPDFLLGAWEREHEVVAERRAAGLGGRRSSAGGSEESAVDSAVADDADAKQDEDGADDRLR